MIKKIFPLLALPIFSAMLGTGIILPLLPLYADKLGATGIWLGIIFAGFSVSAAVCTPFVGWLSDRYGRKVFLSIGLFANAAIALGYIWAHSVLQLTLVRSIQGFASGMIIPVTQAYIGDLSPEGEEGKWMGYFNAAFFTGIGLGPLLGGALSEHFGMDVAFSTMGVLNLLAFLAVIFFLPNIGSRTIATGSRPSFREMTASRQVRGLFSHRLLLELGWGGYFCFFPIFAGIYIGLSTTLIGVLLTINILLIALTLPYTGRIADRFDRKSLTIAGSCVTFIFMALMPLTGNFWQILVLVVFISIGSTITLPAISALGVEEGRKFGMGSTLSLFILAMRIGMAIGPLVSGVIADSAGVNSVFYFSAGMIFAATSLFIWFTRPIRRSPHVLQGNNNGE